MLYIKQTLALRQQCKGHTTQQNRTKEIIMSLQDYNRIRRTPLAQLSAGELQRYLVGYCTQAEKRTLSHAHKVITNSH